MPWRLIWIAASDAMLAPSPARWKTRSRLGFGGSGPTDGRPGNSLASRFGDYLIKMNDYYTRMATPPKKIVADYVAGMTDDYALECVNEIMVPRRFGFYFEEHLYPEPE